MAVIKEMAKGVLAFWCPACKTGHAMDLDKFEWQISGPPNAPTVRPGFVIPRTATSQRCRLYITAGMIDYQADCDHEFAWRTLPMEEF